IGLEGRCSIQLSYGARYLLYLKRALPARTEPPAPGSDGDTTGSEGRSGNERQGSLRKPSMASKNSKRGFSKSTKCVAFLISTLFLDGALVRSRISPSRSCGYDQVSNSPAMTSVGT